MFELSQEQWTWIIRMSLAGGLVAFIMLARGMLSGDIWRDED